MKKKLLLLTVLVFALTCIFAISVSAAEYFGDVEIIDLDKDGVSDISINDRLSSIVDGDGPTASKNARATIKCSCEAGKHTFPAYYLASPKSTGTRFYCFSYDDLNNLLPNYCGATETINGTYITAYEVPNGYKAIYSGFFYDGSTFAGKSIKYFNFNTCPTMTSLETTSSGRNWFTDSSIEAIDIGTSFQTIPVMFLYNCDSLLSVTIPDSVVTIDKLAIYGCDNLKSIIFTENSSLTTLNANALSNNPMLGGLYLPSGLTKLGVGGSNLSPLQGNTNMYLLNSPDETTKPKIYYVPDGIASIEGEIFKNCKNLNDIIVFNESITSISDGWAFCGANAVTLVFLGNITELSTSGTAWTKQTAIYFCNENDVDMNSFTSKNQNGLASQFVFCNAEGNTTHLYLVEKNTAPTCTVDGVKGYVCFCGAASTESEVIKALGHTASEIIKNKYFTKNEDGSYNYFANMIKVCDCTVCDATDVEFDYEGTALFATDKGYSFSETDASSFSYTLHVNVDAIKAYLAENAGFKYGVVVSANTANNPISIVDGAVNKNVAQTIIVELQGSTSVYEYVMTKLTFDADNQGKELICQAYAVDGADNTVSYLGTDKTTINAEVISHAILVKNYQSKEDLANPAA